MLEMLKFLLTALILTITARSITSDSILGKK
uniref:Uncharacterized protein n=1 Tax=Anguilla anguilla TaxID=7936 RepID=A0A0E9SC76_ANGAN